MLVEDGVPAGVTLPVRVDPGVLVANGVTAGVELLTGVMVGVKLIEAALDGVKLIEAAFDGVALPDAVTDDAALPVAVTELVGESGQPENAGSAPTAMGATVTPRNTDDVGAAATAHDTSLTVLYANRVVLLVAYSMYTPQYSVRPASATIATPR